MAKETIPSLIGGKEVWTGPKYSVKSCSLAPEDIYDVCAIKNIEQVDLICETATDGFKKWSNMKYSDRKKILTRSMELLKSYRPELIKAFKYEGLPEWFQHFNADQMVNQFEEYISQASNSEGEIIKSEPNDMAFTVKEPIGPVLSIAPWNAPGILLGRSVIAPLVAGCSVIIKSSELSPKIAFLWAKCLHDGGVPWSTVQLVHVRKEDNVEFVTKFIENPAVRKIAFTGSSSTGSQIAQVAAANLKPCLLELGGKNCAIINHDADLPAAVGACLFAAWGHKGQICMSTDKILVHESRYEEFKQLIQEIGPKVLSEADISIPQRMPYVADSVRSLVEDSLKEGADIIFGNFDDVVSENGLITPLVLANTNKNMQIESAEIFGPIVTISTFKDSAEAVDYVNSSGYGLKTSVWSKDIMWAIKLARTIESGGVHINSPTLYDEPNAPHGGVKDSGYGRFNSKWGIDEFTYVKVITVNS